MFLWIFAEFLSSFSGAGKALKNECIFQNVQQAACVSAAGLLCAAVCVRPAAKNIYEYAPSGCVSLAAAISVSVSVSVSNNPNENTEKMLRALRPLAALVRCALKRYISIVNVARDRCVWGCQSASQSASAEPLGFDSVSQARALVGYSERRIGFGIAHT